MQDYEYRTSTQTEINLGETIKMAVKAPAVADRIFRTVTDADSYIHDNYNSAIAGLVLTVIDDGPNNGVYFVDSEIIGGVRELVLRKLTSAHEVVPYASEVVPGIIQIATLEEAKEGENHEKAITPHTLRDSTYFVYDQVITSDVWVIEHNLNRFPSVTVVDSANSELFGEIRYISTDILQIIFNVPVSGKAYLN